MPFTCKQYSKTFALQATLDNHMLMHTGKKSFTCDQGSESFVRNSGLIANKQITLTLELSNISGEKSLLDLLEEDLYK